MTTQQIHLKRIFAVAVIVVIAFCCTIPAGAADDQGTTPAISKDASPSGKVVVKTDGHTTEVDVDTKVPPSADKELLDKIGARAYRFSEKLPPWARAEYIGVRVWQYIAVFIFVLVGFILKKINDYVFERRVIPLLEKSPFSFDNMLATAASKPLGCLWLLGGVALALSVLSLPTEPDIRKFAFGAVKVCFGAIVVWFLFRIVDVLSHFLAGHAQRTRSSLDDQLIPLFRKALKVTIGLVCFLWVVQLLGYKVSTLLAGLGIGGLAVALALQDTLANLLGSIVILFDRPFRVGDRITVEGVDGIVEEIGLRSTRIRTLEKTLVSIPNKAVAASTVNNITQMPKRKITQTIGVTYDTTADQMKQALEALRDILKEDEAVDQEFIVVRFDDFADSSLNIKVIYFTKTVDYDKHLAVKERINLAIMRALEGLGLSIAFPSRTLYIEKN